MAVNQKRVDEVIRMISSHDDPYWIKSMCQILAELPEFQSPEWIRCDERMPEMAKPISFIAYNRVYAGFTIRVDDGIRFCGVSGDDCANPMSKEATHWMPRHVPAPPVEEESDCVKELKARRDSLQSRLDAEMKKRSDPHNNESGQLAAGKRIAEEFIEIVKKHEAKKAGK